MPNSIKLAKKTVLLHVSAGMLVGILVLIFSEWMNTLLLSNQVQQQRASTLSQLATLRARLEGEVNASLYLTRGLIAYVATHPEVDEVAFAQLASEMVFVDRNIRNIALARDNVITHVYPLAGNETALGVDFREIPGQWNTVKQAMETKATVVAGPVDLVQGGRAFIARTPIYTRSGVSGLLDRHRPSYWGVASTVIDIERLLGGAGVGARTNGLRLALRGKDGLGEHGDMIFGEAALFEKNPVMQSIVLPNGSWQIAAVPGTGWLGSEAVLLQRIVGGMVAILIGTLFGALLWARAENRNLALHDHLTGLPNRRLLKDRFEQLAAQSLRQDQQLEVFYIDLDGFKRVNDQFGHRTGDALLIDVARRLWSSIRAIDAVARVGGDEFIVLAIRERDHGNSEMLARIRDVLSGEAYVDEHEVPLEVSIGTSQFPDDGRSLDSLIKAADQRMYQQKRQGRVRRVEFR